MSTQRNESDTRRPIKDNFPVAKPGNRERLDCLHGLKQSGQVPFFLQGDGAGVLIEADASTSADHLSEKRTRVERCCLDGRSSASGR